MIGGEFEIDLSTQRQDFVEQPDTYYYASGRAALYQIVKSLNVKRVWLPDYLCISVVDAVKKADVDYVFYELDDNLEPILNTLNPSEFDAILLINYYGLKDLSVIEAKFSEMFPYTVLLEDDVQAYFEFDKRDNRYIDYRFTSLRKTFAVPDGGLVYTKHRMPVASEQNSFSPYKFDAGMMKARRKIESIDDSKYLALFEKGEELIDDNYVSVMSLDSRMLFAGVNADAVSRKRKENSTFLLTGLEELGIKTILSVPHDKTPLFIPVYLENRNEVRKRMFANEIYCPVHWPLDGMNLKKGTELAEHELSLIVDQRYSIENLGIMLDILQ